MYLWTYWHSKKEVPAYIRLCFETMNLNSGNFELKVLYEEDLPEYLPELRSDWKKIRKKDNSSLLHLQVGYLKAKFVLKYGGIWTDADTIFVGNLNKIDDLLKEKEFVARYGVYNLVTTGTIAGKKGCTILEEFTNKQDEILDSNDCVVGSRSNFEARILTPIVDKYKNVCHVFDKEMVPIPFHDRYKFFCTDEKSDNYMDDDTICFSLYHSAFPKDFIELSEKEVLSNDFLISKIFRRVLNI